MSEWQMFYPMEDTTGGISDMPAMPGYCVHVYIYLIVLVKFTEFVYDI